MWNLKRINDLVKSGKIRGFKESTGPNVRPLRSEQRRDIHQGDQAKAWIEAFLLDWCKTHAFLLEKELKFHDIRKWRFDWAIRARKIAVEYEGLSFVKTHHTSSKGYTANTDKYNAAAADGWVVFRVTFMNYTTLPKTFEEFEKKFANVQ